MMEKGITFSLSLSLDEGGGGGEGGVRKTSSCMFKTDFTRLLLTPVFSRKKMANIFINCFKAPLQGK